MKNKALIWEKLEPFIRKETDMSPKEKLDHDTQIQDDLGITGDDADPFMEKFFKYFNVKEGDFDLGRYFCGEGLSPFFPFILLWIIALKLFGKKYASIERETLTVGMLEKAIELGKWDTAVIESYFKNEQEKSLEK